jgi:uncharacterized protein (DUF488 family)
LLEREGVRHLADVRRFPVSRRHPHFDSAALAERLASHRVGYEHVPALGGRRTAAAATANRGWREPGFRGYADHMATEEFQSALEALIERARTTPTVVMCAEAVPWRCHRTLIADALVARGHEVRHILDAMTRLHTLTSFAVVRGGRVTYPDPVVDLFTGDRGDT